MMNNPNITSVSQPAQPIEEHPDFQVHTAHLQRIDPEAFEHVEELSAEQIRQMQQQAELPLRDFVWKTRKGAQLLSEMNLNELLEVSLHCLKRANDYQRKIHFFLDVISIAEEHVWHKGGDVPETESEIRRMLDRLNGADLPAPARISPQVQQALQNLP